MNKKSFDALPKDMQNIITETSQETVEWQRKLTEEKVEDAWTAMNKKGLKKYIPTDEERRLFVQATRSVWDNYVNPKEAKPELVDKILSLLGRSRNDLFG
jgi:TRAP-type C4-dicarboxylate transport system substrate-binding protein